ncbi:MAG: Rid family hydrolase [Acetobacteraceae bacterium]
MQSQPVHTDRMFPGCARLSHTAIFEDLMFASGAVAHSPETGIVVSGELTEQARQALENVAAWLESADPGWGGRRCGIGTR